MTIRSASSRSARAANALARGLPGWGQHTSALLCDHPNLERGFADLRQELTQGESVASLRRVFVADDDLVEQTA